MSAFQSNFFVAYGKTCMMMNMVFIHICTKENDIVVCKRVNTACYVKGKLQPTRAFGDLRLKHDEYNSHDYP